MKRTSGSKLSKLTAPTKINPTTQLLLYYFEFVSLDLVCSQLK